METATTAMDITRSIKAIKVFATPGYLREAEKRGSPQNLTEDPLKILTEALTKQPSEPTWVVIEPGLSGPQDEDEGRTRKLPGLFRYWAIRDDHPSECECGCGGVSIVTFLLPEEY